MARIKYYPPLPHYPFFMSCPQFSPAPRSPAPRRSLLLASAGQRLLAALCVVAALWALTSWALGWW